MKVVTREVYYCEFCKRHRLSKSAIEKHEPRCIYNPDRAVCGWHRDRAVTRPADLVATYRETRDTDWLHDETEGCPACMLAVVVQARRLGYDEGYYDEFSYMQAVEEFRKQELEDASYAF